MTLQHPGTALSGTTNKPSFESLVSTTQPSGGSDAPRPLDETTRQRFRRQPRQDTQPELELRRELHRRGLRYRVERKILPDTRRRADVVFPTERVAVFIDGCFWHSGPDHGTVPRNNREWWVSKLQSNVERDRDTDWRLAETGWLAIRVWEHEAPTEAADRIERAVRARRPG